MSAYTHKGEYKMTIKEKKEILNSFSMIQGRIIELEEALKNWWARATSQTPSLTGMPSSNVDTNKTQFSIEKMEELKKALDAEYDELTVLQCRIIKAIKKLPSITERRVIYLKYIGENSGKYHKSLPLWKIANKLGYSYDRIKHLHGLALLHLEL